MACLAELKRAPRAEPGRAHLQQRCLIRLICTRSAFVHRPILNSGATCTSATLEFLRFLLDRAHLPFKQRSPSYFDFFEHIPRFQRLRISHDCALRLHSVLSCIVGRQVDMRAEDESAKSFTMKRFGGRDRDRTGDPLLAKRTNPFQQPPW